MGPAFYVMAILGCGEADAACQPVAMAETRYESLEACNAATEAAVLQNVDLAFPVVTAQCRRADSNEIVELKPADIDLPEPDTGRPAPRIQRADYQPPKRLKL